MSTAVTIPIYNSDDPLPNISGSTPWGYYDNDTQFQSDAPRFVTYITRTLGYPIVNIEMQAINMFAAFEHSVATYSKELYEYKIRDNYLSLEGATTGSNLNTTLIQPNLANLIRIAKDYGSEAGSGGNVNYYTGSINLAAGQQEYDLNYWASASGIIAVGDSIEVKRVFYEATPAIARYFDPYAGTGLGMESLLTTFGFTSLSPGISFMMLPANYDVLRIQAIEFSDQIRRSAYTFEIHNNRLRIFPIPTFDKKLWFTYIKNSERSSLSRGSANDGLVTNISNVPFTNITYSQINSVGRRWIFDYGLAICKEILGNIRNKYSAIPVPGAEVVLNGQNLIDQSRIEQDKLIDQLRLTLEDTSRRNQLQRKKEEDEAMSMTLANVPLAIYIG